MVSRGLQVLEVTDAALEVVDGPVPEAHEHRLTSGQNRELGSAERTSRCSVAMITGRLWWQSNTETLEKGEDL